MYDPSDNDFDDEFDVTKIEQMEVEFKTCPHCGGEGYRNNGIYTFTCPVCYGCGTVPLVKEGVNMNLSQALQIVKDHIRIGKGMELDNGVPEALEMVVEELAVTQKALDIAVEEGKPEDCGYCIICDRCSVYGEEACLQTLRDYFLQQAKEGEK